MEVKSWCGGQAKGQTQKGQAVSKNELARKREMWTESRSRGRAAWKTALAAGASTARQAGASKR